MSSWDTIASNPLTAALCLAGGIALLLLGGHGLVSGSITIARRLGLSTLFIGITVVAFGTSSPELFFNVIAALGGHGDLSFGNIVGSNIANIGLILGLTALATPLVVHGRVVSKELPWLIGVSFGMIVLAFFPAPGFDRLDGLLLLGSFAGFMYSWARMGRRDQADPLLRELGREAEAESRSMAVAWILFMLGLAGLVTGGKLTEIGAVNIAQWLGLSESLIGLTIVAVATSLPELATSYVACRRGHHDLAVGNIVGANVFNLLLVLAVTILITPVPVPARGMYDLIAMGALTLILLPIASTNRNKITRREGAALLILYVGYMTWSVLREQPWG